MDQGTRCNWHVPSWPGNKRLVASPEQIEIWMKQTREWTGKIAKADGMH